MARRHRAEKREIDADPKFGSIDVAKFINRVMIGGKKTIARKVVYSAIEIAEEKAKRPGLEVFDQAIRNTVPLLEVKSRRVGGSTYQVPNEVRPERRTTLAMRWIISAARSRSGRPMAERLSQELLEASRGEGTAVKRKDDLHRMAEANKAFAHYRW
ncbi:MAG: 30S ribosomal protein S7 [Dehalococcoidia bacterium]|nr:30S ribosomal protein S7 [Dehalococcoidia bacterium]|tara:strand:+ start:833 stop:1303 length:471 start_codon:yes stop_codon:yes gene_type:complete